MAISPKFVITFLIIATTISTNYFAMANNQPRTKCNIRIDNPHLSEYIKRTTRDIAVKVNARSKCDKPMTNVRLVVQIYKVGIFRDYLVDEKVEFVKGFIFPNRIVKNNKSYVVCKTRKETKFYGKAFATAEINGKSMKILPVLSPKTVKLACGT